MKPQLLPPGETHDLVAALPSGITVGLPAHDDDLLLGSITPAGRCVLMADAGRTAGGCCRLVQAAALITAPLASKFGV